MAKKMGPIEERYRDDEITVEQWSERDRSFIGIQEVDTGEYLAEWWDEDVLQMFEDGFFEPGRLEMSVIEYADEIGIPASSKKKRKRKRRR